MLSKVKPGAGSDRGSDRGVALITVMMIMLLMSALMIGFATLVSSDQRFRGIDKDRMRAYYGATSGLEKLTTDLGNLFLTNVAPTPAQIAALSSLKPTIPSVTFTAPAGLNSYAATLVACNAQGATACNAQVTSGPYQGLIALKQLYRMDVVAKTTNSGEVHLTRNLETVAIPVFQFGMFSDVDLSFFAGPNFGFGGRVHTNGNLFLAQGNGNTLTLNQKVTAYGEVVRNQMQNGVDITNTVNGGAHDGTISMATGNNSFRNLAATEGSVTGGLTPKTLNPNWPTISLSSYNGYIRNSLTGAKPLNLALIAVGGANTDMVRRPVQNENVNNPVLYGERMYPKVSLRIMLSDTIPDIMNLPQVSATPPVRLGDEVVGGLSNDWAPPANGQPAGYGPVDATHPPIARSPGPQNVDLPNAPGGNVAAGAPTITIQTTAQLSGTYNSPANMQFIIRDTVLNGGGALQTVNCSTVRATAATTITLGQCKKNLGGNLVTIPANGQVTILDQNATQRTYLATAQVNGGVAGPLDYAFTSTPTNNNIVTNTFWMVSSAAATPGAWNLVTCDGVGATSNNALTAVTQLVGCTNVPQANGGVGAITNGALSQAFTGTIGGYLKIDMQDAAGTWRDVTMEILNWGFADRNQTGAACGAGPNGDPTPNAIIRLQRLRDHSNPNWCTYAGTTSSYDFWPNTIYDPREGLMRDAAPAVPTDAVLGGVMHYVAIDVGNLSRWFQGAAPYAAGSGPQALSNNGYSLYFSDRRNNRADGTNGTTLNGETGEYGFEDFVNPTAVNGVPNLTLDAGEDVNGNGLLDRYGRNPSFLGKIDGATPVPLGAVAPLNAAAQPTTFVGRAYGETNRAIIFRRALKLQNASAGNIVLPGFTVIAENPVYVQGDWNANQAGWTNNPAATSIIADAVTLLSNQWTDANGWANPYNINNRARTTPAWYRMAIIGGKGRAFPNIPGTPNDFGTDGGAHNFLRYLESGQTVNYQGSIATFYFNRQAVGTYKCCNTVYGAPVRNYLFDVSFLNPATLPPLVPVFRDINITGFSQETRPGK